MSKYKMIAFDIDGTILDNNHNLSSELKSIVDYIIKKDYIVTLSTARLPISAIEVAKELNLKPNIGLITLNGGFITNCNKEVLYTKTFNWCHHDITNSTQSLYDQVVVNYYHEFDWLVNKPSVYTDMENSFFDNDNYPQIGSLATVNKITMMGDNADLINIKYNLSNNEYLLSFSHPNYLEVTTHEITKFTALVHYANIMGIDHTQIIAFGDGENDIPMLQNVGMGIAMGNANQQVKDIAYDITDSNTNNGVFNYLDKLLKIGIL